MLSLDNLNEASTPAPKPAVTGKWFEIRLTPDLVSGELLNIGVGFIQARTRLFFFKLLDSAAPFGCLYGPKGREQFGFLLNTVRESLASQGPISSISPHISYGQPRHAQGASVEAILDSLYQTVVTLGRRSVEIEALTAGYHVPRSTEHIRHKARIMMRKADPQGFTSYWRETPVSISADGHSRQLDVQIWQQQGNLFSPRSFATIVSTCYRSPLYRKAYLTGAYQDLTVARNFLQHIQEKAAKESRGGVFILRSADDDYANDADNEIDTTVWALRKEYGITPHVEDNATKLLKQVLEFVR